MTKEFARLEIIDGAQILAERIYEHGEGTKIRLRRDGLCTLETTLGPWPDTDEGERAAEKTLLEMDMAKSAEILDKLIRDMMAGDTDNG